MNKPGWLVVLGVIGGILGMGLIFMVAGSPRGEAIQLLPAPTQPLLAVYVTGEVASPGVYTLPPGSRVQDALEAAGGLTSAAQIQGLNLAQMLTDGLRVVVPGSLATDEPPPTAGETRGGQLLSGLININTATQAELESLPEIGPVLAEAIIAYREANGPFESIEDIVDVDGVGSGTFALIRDLITVEAAP